MDEITQALYSWLTRNAEGLDMQEYKDRVMLAERLADMMEKVGCNCNKIAEALAQKHHG